PNAAAVAHAIKACQVRRDFTRHNQVVRCQCIIKVRAVYFDGFSTLCDQLVNGCAIRFHHTWLPAITLKLLNQTDLNASEIPLSAFTCCCDDGSNRAVDRGCIEFVMACDNLVQ